MSRLCSRLAGGLTGWRCRVQLLYLIPEMERASLYTCIENFATAGTVGSFSTLKIFKTSAISSRLLGQVGR